MLVIVPRDLGLQSNSNNLSEHHAGQTVVPDLVVEVAARTQCRLGVAIYVASQLTNRAEIHISRITVVDAMDKSCRQSQSLQHARGIFS